MRCSCVGARNKARGPAVQADVRPYRSPMTRTFRALLLIGAACVILAWASGCYLTLLVHDDCVDALNKSSGERELYAAIVQECAGSDDRLKQMSTWGLAISAAVSAGLLWLRARLARTPSP